MTVTAIAANNSKRGRGKKELEADLATAENRETTVNAPVPKKGRKALAEPDLDREPLEAPIPAAPDVPPQTGKSHRHRESSQPRTAATTKPSVTTSETVSSTREEGFSAEFDAPFSIWCDTLVNLEIQTNRKSGSNTATNKYRFSYNQTVQQVLDTLANREASLFALNGSNARLAVRFRDWRGRNTYLQADSVKLSYVGLLDGAALGVLSTRAGKEEFRILSRFKVEYGGYEELGTPVKGKHSLEDLPVATPSFPVLGNLPAAKANMLGFISSNSYDPNIGREHGLYRFQILNQNQVVVCNPGTVKAVLDDFASYKKGFSQTGLFDSIMRDGMFNSYGNHWDFSRKVSPWAYQDGFSSAVLMPKINRYPQILFKTWDDPNNANYKPDNENFDLFPEIENVLADIFGDVLASHPFDRTRNQGGNAVGYALSQSINLLKKRQIYLLLPGLASLPTPSNVQYENSVKEVRECFRQAVKNKRYLRDSETYEAQDILDLLLRTRDEETGEQFTDEGLVDEMMSDLFSAESPTSVCIAWLIYELARNQSAQAKCYAEVKAALGRRSLPLDWSKLDEQFPYLTMALNESLRLHPVAPILSRAATRDVTLAGFNLPANTQVNVPTWVLHRDPELWDNADAFDPDRFSASRRASILPYSYFPFGLGPRNCIAAQLSYNVARVFTITLLQKYNVTVTDNRVIEPDFKITLFLKGGLPVQLSRRYPLVPEAEKLPQFCSASELAERASQMTRRREKYQLTNTLNDWEVNHKLPGASLPPFWENFDVAAMFGGVDNMPIPDSLALLLGVVRAKINTHLCEWKALWTHVGVELSDFFKQQAILGGMPDVETINDYLQTNYGKRVLSSSIVNVPASAYAVWINDDREFGRQRLAGQHPCLITRCRKGTPLPFTLPAGEDDRVVKEAQARDQLFYVDYEICFLSADLIKPGAVLPAPIGLFHVNDQGDLMPLGIYFFRNRNKPLYVTPKDDPILWLLAKMHLQNADNHYQQFVHHLPFTHMIVEPILLATKFCLPDNHPIGRFLIPHFRGTLQINFLARSILINRGGLIDQSMSGGRIGALAISNRAYQRWNFKDRSLETDLKKRGVDDARLLPYYPYRDCGRIINDAFHDLARDLVFCYYETEELLQHDQELQNFAKEMYNLFRSTQDDSNHDFGLHDSFASREALISFLGNLLFTVAVQHSILNYADLQYHGFYPNSPTVLHTDLPESKENCHLVLDDLQKALPTIDEGLKIVGFAKLLSEAPLPQDTLGLSDMESRYQLQDPRAREIIRSFQKRLRGPVTEAMRRISTASEANYGFGYPYMEPAHCTYGLQI